MKILRIVATLVTGGTMLVGGVLLTTSGQPAVIALGAVTAAVGTFYAFAGLTVERVMTTARPRQSKPVAAEIADGNTVAASTGLLARHSFGQTSSARPIAAAAQACSAATERGGAVRTRRSCSGSAPSSARPAIASRPNRPMSPLAFVGRCGPARTRTSQSHPRDAAGPHPSTDDLLTSTSSSPATGWFEQLRDATPRS